MKLHLKQWVKNTASPETFFCFSPVVMIATCVIELVLAVYVAIRYRLSPLARLVTVTLICLAGFQWIEYQTCAHFTGIQLTPRIGFMIISFLPILALHIVKLLTGESYRLWPGYALAAIWSIIFIGHPDAMHTISCTPNYIVFNLSPILATTYFIYYFSFLFLGLWCLKSALWYGPATPNRKKIIWLLIGYLSFLLPMGVLSIMVPATRLAIPSVMCGFAVLFALSLAFGVMPSSSSEKNVV